MKPDEVYKKRLRTIENVSITSIHFDTPYTPYFVAEIGGGAEVEVRVHHKAPELQTFIQDNQKKALDLVIFPYQWRVPSTNASGVANYLQSVTVRT